MSEVKLYAPENAGSVGFDGQEYEVADGCVIVPAAAVELLVSHGFTTEAPQVEESQDGEPVTASRGRGRPRAGA